MRCFFCAQTPAGVLFHKLDDHRRQGDKEDDADDAKELSADHGGNKGVKRGKPYGLSHHTGIDELVFNKLYGKIHDKAAHGQHRVNQQHKEHADYAGDQRTHIGDDGADGGQHPHQTAVGDPENGKRKGHQNAKDHRFAALSCQKACEGLTEQPAEFQDSGGVVGLQVGTHQCAGVMAKALRPKGHIDGDDQRKRGSHHDIHRGGYCPYCIDQHSVDACGDLVQQLFPVDAFQPAHQPAHVGILCAEIGGPAGDVGFDLHIKAVEGLYQLRDQQGQSQHQHQSNTQQGDEKAEKMDGFSRGLLFRLAEQAFQPLFQPGHGHIDEKRQNTARQNGQHQIYELCGKGQNGREPQQRYKKRYPYNGNKQILFCFWFHAKILSRRFMAAGCKKTVCGLFIVFLKNSACQNGILVRCSLRMLLVYL